MTETLTKHDRRRIRRLIQACRAECTREIDHPEAATMQQSLLAEVQDFEKLFAEFLGGQRDEKS
jgi:hypothetical protein